jgi:hypothetical protein
LASTPCTSTSTRPSRRRMAAAGRDPGRWCCRRRSGTVRASASAVRRSSRRPVRAGRRGKRRRTPRAELRTHGRVSMAKWACSRAALSYMLQPLRGRFGSKWQRSGPQRLISCFAASRRGSLRRSQQSGPCMH